MQTQIWKSDSTAKLPMGPTGPSPGPVLLMVANTAENAVMGSNPDNSSRLVNTAMDSP
ncbi:hypothetical protein D3C71_1298940 [compost metagenome]